MEQNSIETLLSFQLFKMFHSVKQGLHITGLHHGLGLGGGVVNEK